MPVRHNILENAPARDQYIEGVRLLDQEFPGPTTSGLNIPGPDQQLSTWDLFCLWHYFTMNIATPAGSARNAAHRGPVFLPWHRWMLLLLEFHFQRVLDNPDFGLPYWDWAADGDQPAADQPNLPIWSDQVLGGSGSPVTDGPFAFNPADPQSFRIRVAENLFTGNLVSQQRGLRREIARGVPSLPTTAQVDDTLVLTSYDGPNFDAGSQGFRNQLEGWVGIPFEPGTHNRVHVWIGGDMSPGTSPNDPAFYLNHCNVDRLWQAFIERNGPVYQPGDSASQDLFRHRPSDPLVSMLTNFEPLVSQMFDVSSFYTYDVLP